MADPVNVPTWTGRAGLGGAPAVVREREAAAAARVHVTNAAKPRFGNVTKSAAVGGGVVGSLQGPALVADDRARAAGAAAAGAAGSGSVRQAAVAGGEGAGGSAGESGFGSAASCGVVGEVYLNPTDSKELLQALRARGILDASARNVGEVRESVSEKRQRGEREGGAIGWRTGVEGVAIEDAAKPHPEALVLGEGGSTSRVGWSVLGDKVWTPV